MNNTFGKTFRLTLSGESHSKEVGIQIDNIPSGVEIEKESLNKALKRRKFGELATISSIATTARKEEDTPIIKKGLIENNKCYITNGESIIISFENNNIIPKDYSNFVDTPRPSHADFVRRIKYGKDYSSGGGIASGRMTLPLVMAGEIAKSLISTKLNNINISAKITEIGGQKIEKEWVKLIHEVAEAKDSVGAIIECTIGKLPIGIGEPFFDSLESIISHLIFSVPGIKGIEFGNGFLASRLLGSQNNDCYISKDGKTLTNNSGGINGGISNGNDIVFRVAIKPTPSIAREQESYNFKKNELTKLEINGRHDTCFALRCPVIIEAISAIAIAELI